MLSDREIGIHRFFDRPDPEKQFLYKLMLEEPDPQAALDNYRDENRSEEETVKLAEEY